MLLSKKNCVIHFVAPKSIFLFKLSISSKTKINPISYTKGIKTSVVIEKTIYRKKSNVNRGQKSEKNFNRYSDVQKVTQNKNYPSKTATPKKSFEIRTNIH